MNMIQQQYFNHGAQFDSKQGKQLELGTISNYKAAVNYYLQKEAAFAKYAINQTRKQVRGDTEKFKKRFSQLFTDQITKKWNNEIREKIISAVSIDLNSGAAGKYSIKAGGDDVIRSIGELTEEQQNKIINGAIRGGNIYSVLGFTYEDYLIPALQAKSKELMNEVGMAGMDYIIGNLLQEIESTGGLTSSSAKRGTGFIRPDLGANLSGAKDINNQVQYGKSQGGKQPLPVELQCDVTIDYQKIDNEYVSRWTEEKLLKKYLNSQMYGMQVKAWKGKTFNNKTFTQMASLQERLNQTFYNQYTSLKYAGQVLHYEVSREIFDIVGIVNVGIVTGESFMWISNLLSNYLFSMNLTKAKGDIDFGEVRVLNSDIILRKAIGLLESQRLIGKVSEKKEIALTDKKGDVIGIQIPLTFKIASQEARKKS